LPASSQKVRCARALRKIPNPNVQIPNKLQIPNHKSQNQAHAFEHQHTVATRSDGATRRPLGFGILLFGVFLGFGILRSAHCTFLSDCGYAALRDKHGDGHPELKEVVGVAPTVRTQTGAKAGRERQARE